MKECPRHNLEMLLHLIPPIVFHQVFYEKPPKYERIKESIPNLSPQSLEYLFREESKDYMQGNLNFLAFLYYFREDISGIELNEEEARLIARTSLKKHVNECSNCRDFYLEDFLTKQLNFYKDVLGISEVDEDYVKDIDEYYLGLLI
ncbi:hypothetical protein J4221_03645 [Candidatus Pacearchaeota archaeon]|nr:hypothetical protein [Candidatus Pacearchaeota archaeon]